MAFERWVSSLLLLATVTGCGGGLRKFPLRAPLWRDPDQRAFAPKPEEHESAFFWDAANQTVFRPASRFFAVDPAGEAVNVNALDEVPDSSWFTNRIGRFDMSAEAVATGACRTPLPGSAASWTVTAAKPNGFNPGFFVRDGDARRYLMKFDGPTEGSRPTAADVISTRLFHAAGYFVPCNRIVYFERARLQIGANATSENEGGERVRLGERDVDRVLAKARRAADGRYRASQSLLVEGQPIGPWRYEGTRSDDPNDVVNHEDRRELRGMEVLAAWLALYDSREQNTMASFVGRGRGGYVRHYMLDVGNAFGPVWEPPMLGRRIGHAYYLDVPYILEDFVTLGALQRPWDELRFGPTGSVFGYFDLEHFDPDKFRPGYPNPAFVRKSERDAAWMARIIARISETHLRAIVKMGGLSPAHEARLTNLLLGRRRKLLRRYLSKLSPLTWPSLRPGQRLCMQDLAVSSHIAVNTVRHYRTRAWSGDELVATLVSGAAADRHGEVCLDLPAAHAGSALRYLIVDVVAQTRGEPAELPVRVHLYATGEGRHRIVGLERPYDAEAPRR